jgi:hypothetical protein
MSATLGVGIGTLYEAAQQRSKNISPTAPANWLIPSGGNVRNRRPANARFSNVKGSMSAIGIYYQFELSPTSTALLT